MASNIWLLLLSFLLPVVELVAAHIVNTYKASGGKVEWDMVGPGWFAEANILEHLWGSWVETPVETEDKGGDCNSEER